MTQSSIGMVEIYRKVEALEAALACTVACVSTLAPSVKVDVIKNLRIWAEQNNADATTSKAFNDLANKMESINFTVNN
ncbi:hypothetical protein ACIPUO_06305 [Pectobacterium carotovorum]|uniref:hypothetical protein n=1 Tax=Pectobacterium carotovorum TaxID=554 RepID=UPI00381BE9B3